MNLNNKTLKMQVRIFIIFLFLCSNVQANTNYSFKCIASDFQCIESNGFEKFKIGDDESLEYLYLFKDNFLILLIKMNANKGLMNSSTEYIFIEESGKKIKPYYISPEIDKKITESEESGILVYELDDVISSSNWKEDKYFLFLKHKKDFKLNKTIDIDRELLNSKEFTSFDVFKFDSFEKHFLEAKMLLTISDLEKPKSKEIIKKDSINEFLEEIGNYSDLTESYNYLYLKSFTEENINFSIPLFDSSFSKGNKKENFMNNYFNESIEYSDALFEGEKFEELKDRTDTCLSLFKNFSTSNKDQWEKLNFYNTYSMYYLIQTDKEIIDNKISLRKKFEDYIKYFNNSENKELECYSRLAYGNIEYVIGNKDIAVDQYKLLSKDENTPTKIKDKAEANLKKLNKDQH
ncbi:MAG: hypothetical protein WAT71_12245 [Ignavibacteria bacterium]